MNKKQYRTTLGAFGLISVGLIASNYALYYADWMVIFIIISAFYIYLRYKISSPLQQFSTKFNMLVDYDLDVEEALKLVQERYENAPTESVKALYQLYLGMALYYNAKYREAMNTFNQINMPKVNPLYHVLIYAFTAYAALEEGDTETFDLSLSRLGEMKTRIKKKYLNFAMNYEEILKAIKNIEFNPEHYKEIMEGSFGREDGFISTKLIYNYRMAYYYKAVHEVEEMDRCLAKVIANGKNHHTAIQAREMFQNTCNIEDFIFPAPGEEPEDVEVVEEPLQIDALEEVTIVEETSDKEEKE